MGTVDLRDLSLEYYERGSGPAVVFVHGSASDHRTWDQQLPAFEGRFRTISFSRRYHWPNAPPSCKNGYGMPEQVEDLDRLLQSLDAGPVHLVGHSYGAYLCLMFALENSSRINRLVLAEPPVIPLFTSFPPKPHEILRLLLTHPPTALQVIKFAATGLVPAMSAAKKGDMERATRRFGTAVLGKKAFAALPPARVAQVRANFHESELLSDNFMTPLDPSEIARVAIPTLLVIGENSPRLFHRLTGHLQRLLPLAEKVVIPDASHITHEDNAAAYNRAVLSFLQS
ncbi:MAG: alpha/beta hydrolase [Sneathiella sp.]